MNTTHSDDGLRDFVSFCEALETRQNALENRWIESQKQLVELNSTLEPLRALLERSSAEWFPLQREIQDLGRRIRILETSLESMPSREELDEVRSNLSTLTNYLQQLLPLLAKN